MCLRTPLLKTGRFNLLIVLKRNKRSMGHVSAKIADYKIIAQHFFIFMKLLERIITIPRTNIKQLILRFKVRVQEINGSMPCVWMI